MKKHLSLLLTAALLLTTLLPLMLIPGVSAASEDVCLYKNLLADGTTGGSGSNCNWSYADNVLTIESTSDEGCSLDIWDVVPSFNVATQKGIIFNYVSEVPVFMCVEVTTKSGTKYASTGSDFYPWFGYDASDLTQKYVNGEQTPFMPAGSRSAIMNLNAFFTWNPSNDQTPADGNSRIGLLTLRLGGKGKIEIYALHLTETEPTEVAKEGGTNGYLSQNTTIPSNPTLPGSAPEKLTVKDGVYYYEIDAAEQLAYIAQQGGDWLEYNYMLTTDLVVNEQPLTYDKQTGKATFDTENVLLWSPIDGFNGIFDGNGHSVSGLYVYTNDAAGMFGDCNGYIRNLTVNNSYIRGNSYVGGICGRMRKDMTDCAFSGAVVGNQTNPDSYWYNYCTGGLVGYADDYSYDILNCRNDGDVFAISGCVGGICGTGTDIRNCQNSGAVSGNNYVGGISGTGYYINNCQNSGAVSGKNYVGGISGEEEYIYNCQNSGVVSGADYVGGISGTGYDIYNCQNSGKVSGKNSVGGICGYAARDEESYNLTITDCTSSAPIVGESNVGGICGYMKYYEVSDCINYGNVSGSSTVGAVIGNTLSVLGKGSVTNCYYRRTGLVNRDITGFGNAPDTEGVVWVLDEENPPLAPGDINGDEEITGTDVVLLRRAVAENETLSAEQIAAADVNGDGDFTGADVVLLRRYVAELVDVLG